MRQRKPTTVRAWIALGVLSVLLFYALSTGPAEWLISNGKLSEAGAARLHAFYTPIQWLCQHMPWLNEVFTVYIETWID